MYSSFHGEKELAFSSESLFGVGELFPPVGVMSRFPRGTHTQRCRQVTTRLADAVTRHAPANVKYGPPIPVLCHHHLGGRL